MTQARKAKKIQKPKNQRVKERSADNSPGDTSRLIQKSQSVCEVCIKKEQIR